MTHDCLNHFQIGFVFAKSGTKCVPQMVARKIGKNNRLSPFSFGLYDFLGIVAMSDSLDRAVNGLRIRHAAIPVDEYESSHSINNRLVEAVFFLFFSFKHESIIHCVQHRNGPNTGFGFWL